MSTKLRTGVRAAILVTATMAFSQPVYADQLEPYKYARLSCYPDLWQSQGFASYGECFDYHFDQYVQDVCWGDLEQC